MQQDRNAGQGPGDLPGGVKSIYHRHYKIEDDDIRFAFFRQKNGLGAVPGFGTNVPVRVSFERQAQETAVRRTVIGNQDSHLQGPQSARRLIFARCGFRCRYLRELCSELRMTLIGV
jgi:hypothetical protein